MAGIATLTMLLSRYVMKVARATASRAHERRRSVVIEISSAPYMYVVQVRCTADTIRRIVVNRAAHEDRDPPDALPRPPRRPGAGDRRRRRDRGRHHPPGGQRARRDPDGPLLALP